jgi:intraflagellar transport protein 140
MAIFVDHRVQALHPGQNQEIHWHKSHALLAVASFNPTTGANVSVYQEEGELLTSSVVRKSKEATALAFHPTRKVLAVGWATGEVTVRNEQDNEAYDVAPVHKTEITIMQWTTNGSRLLTADASGLLVFWKADGRGRLNQTTLCQHKLDEQLTQVVLTPPPPVDPSLDVASLAKAAVSGDESALDMFAWQKGKVNMKMTLGQQESLTFFLGGRNGSVFYVNEECQVKQQFVAEAAISKLLYYNEKNILVTVTTTLKLTLHSVNSDGVTRETLNVKLSGKPDKVDTIWAGKGIIATCTGERYIRMWDLDHDENYLLGLKVNDVLDNTEMITCIAYSEPKGLLAGGTTSGRVGLWKFSPGNDIKRDEPEDRWKSQTPSVVAGPILDISFGSSKGLLAVNTIDNVYILVQQQTYSHCCNGMVVVQIGAKQLSVDIFAGNTGHYELKTDIQVKGVAVTKEALAIIDGRRVVVYEIVGGASPFRAAGSFSTTSQFMCLHEQNVYTLEPGKIQVRNYQGTVKQLLPLPDNSDEVVSLEVCSQYLVVATAAGAIKIFDLSRREAKPHAGPRYLLGNVPEFGHIASAKCNANGSRASITVFKPDGTRDSRLYIWDIELDSITFFNFASGCDDSDDTIEGHIVNDEDDTAAEKGKRQAARDVAGRRPISHCWDWEEPRLLVCEAERLPVSNESSSVAKQTAEAAHEGQADVIVISLFVTSEHGFLIQDSFPLESTCSCLATLEIPYYYFIKRVDQIKTDDKSSTAAPGSLRMSTVGQPGFSTIGPQSMAVQRVHRDFVGLEDAEKSAKAAMMDFSFFLTLGDMDEAFKAMKVIKSDSVWENMAKMCVKTRRLDVAQVCLGNMRNARAAMCLRAAVKESEIDARVAVLAIQLGLHQDAERLLRNCKRYDLLNEFYQSRGNWDKALEVADMYDRIHLRTTCYNYAKFLESTGNFVEAIKFYERSNTHRFEVPRMLGDDIEKLQIYINNSQDKALSKWWAQYLESSGNLDMALQYYQSAKDYLSLVRVYCYSDQLDKAAAVCNETQDRAACYHVARQYENSNEFEQAINYFSRAQAYGNAVRLCKEHGFDDKLMNMALLGKPDDMVEAARYYEFKPGHQEKAVTLYHKAGYFSKALELAFSSKQYAALHVVSESLDERTDPQLLQRCADFFIENSQFDRAVDLLATARRYWDALKLCMEQHIPMTEELVEKLTPSKDMDARDPDERNKILEGVGDVCMAQRQYHLAAKKFTQSGNRVKAMKALLKSGDTEKIIYFANVSRQKEIYVMAGHYLQSLEWQSDPEIMRNIIGFYTKGRAPEPLAGFYDACAQLEIDEFQNYEKALGALGEAYKVLSKATSADANVQEMKLNDLKNRMMIIKKFLQAKSTYEKDSEEAMKQCRALLAEPNCDKAVRFGDICGMMTEHYARLQQWKAAYSCIEDLRSRVPKVNVGLYVDQRALEAVHRALNIPLKDLTGGGTANVNEPVKNGFLSRSMVGDGDEEEGGEILEEDFEVN